MPIRLTSPDYIDQGIFAMKLDVRLMGGPVRSTEKPVTFFPIDPAKLVLDLRLAHHMAVVPVKGDTVRLIHEGRAQGAHAVYHQLRDWLAIQTFGGCDGNVQPSGRFILEVPSAFRSMSVVANDPTLSFHAGDVRPSIAQVEIAAAREVSVSGRHILINAAQPDSKPLDVTIVQSPYNLAFEAETATNSYILGGRGTYIMTRHGQSLFAVMGRKASLTQVGGMIKRGQVYAKSGPDNGVHLSNEDLCPDIPVTAYGSDKEMRAREQEVRNAFIQAVRRDVDQGFVPSLSRCDM
jgi:hypothetical protein